MLLFELHMIGAVEVLATGHIVDLTRHWSTNLLLCSDFCQISPAHKVHTFTVVQSTVYIEHFP